MPVYLEVVSPLENIVEDLKSLPPARLEVAADFVHRLKRISEEERQAALARISGARPEISYLQPARILPTIGSMHC